MSRPVYEPGSVWAEGHKLAAREVGLTERQAAVIADLTQVYARTLRLHEAMSLTAKTAPFMWASTHGRTTTWGLNAAGRELGERIKAIRYAHVRRLSEERKAARA
jgi:hypothetical protein